MDRIIFSNRITGRMLLYIVALVAFGGVFLYFLDEGQNVLVIIGLTLVCMLILPLAFWLIIHFSGRSLIAELIVRDDALQLEMVHMFGKGKKFEIPIPPASDWSWYSQKENSTSMQRVGVIKFKSGDTAYEMALDGAKIVDEVELRKLAPKMVDEMIASKVMVHKPA